MNSGTRAFTFAMMGNELVSVIYDSRWLLATILICVLADFRYGWGESSKRYKRAKEKGDKIVMAQYKWRTSRAMRRTVNKLIDYFMWVTLGMFFGWAILKPLGVDHVMGGVVATTVAIACEAKSFCGHFFYLHGIKIEEKSVKHFFYLHGIKIEEKSVKGFLRAFVVAFAKRKNEDLGEALEEGFNSNDKTETK